jgi:hypothetical protein
MARRVRQLSFVFALCGLALPLYAADGVLVVEQTTTGGAVRTSRVQIEPQRMRVEVADAGGMQVVIFDGAKQVLWVVDQAKKSYMEMTKADVDRMGGQMNSMMQAMQEQLKNMPPAARAQMEAIMKGRGGAAMPGMPGAAPQTEYRPTGAGTVGPWRCAGYDGFQGDQKTTEICTVEPAALGFTSTDFAVSGQLAQFFRALMPQNADQLFSIGTLETQGFSGVPVKRVSLTGQRSATEVTEVTRQTFPDSLFVVPDGFTRQAMPMGLGR